MILIKLLSIFKKSHLKEKASEIEAEMCFHLEMSQSKFEAEGYSAQEAEKMALQAFGDKTYHKKKCIEIHKKQIRQHILIGTLLITFFTWSTATFIDKPTWKKVSPFEAVRVEADQVKVYLNLRWYQLQSINGYSTEQLLSYTKYKFKSKGEKRFVEDIYEVLKGVSQDESFNLVGPTSNLNSKKSNTVSHHVSLNNLAQLKKLNVAVELVGPSGFVISKQLKMTSENRRKVWLYARQDT